MYRSVVKYDTYESLRTLIDSDSLHIAILYGFSLFGMGLGSRFPLQGINGPTRPSGPATSRQLHSDQRDEIGSWWPCDIAQKCRARCSYFKIWSKATFRAEIVLNSIARERLGWIHHVACIPLKGTPFAKVLNTSTRREGGTMQRRLRPAVLNDSKVLASDKQT